MISRLGGNSPTSRCLNSFLSTILRRKHVALSISSDLVYSSIEPRLVNFEVASTDQTSKEHKAKTDNEHVRWRLTGIILSTCLWSFRRERVRVRGIWIIRNDERVGMHGSMPQEPRIFVIHDKKEAVEKQTMLSFQRKWTVNERQLCWNLVSNTNTYKMH